MTKEQIKFIIDNIQTINDEINQRSDSLAQEIDLPDDISAEIIRDIYDKYYKYFFDIYDKYNIDYDAFATIMAISFREQSFREQILGRDEANQLLRDVIDIYGDEAYEILGCDLDTFEMSEMDGLLQGENNQTYKEFYKKTLNKKCEQASNLKQLSDILLSTRPEYVNQELIESFLKNPDKKVFDFSIRGFIDTAPSAIINGNTVKALVDRLDNIMDTSILEEIPPELFDADFSRSLLEKSNDAVGKVFYKIPEQLKDRDMWEFAISRDGLIVCGLPEKIDDNMTDEEYREWCNELIVDVMRNNPDNISRIFYNLRDSKKTIEVCAECARLLPKDVVESFLEQVPEASRSRQMYEALLQKSIYIIRKIPNEVFEEGVSQEDYATWVDDIVTQKISEMADIEERDIPREKMTERVWNALLDKCDDKSRFGLSSVPIQNITTGMCERALKDIGRYQIMYIPSIDRNLDTIIDNTVREEYEKWIAGFSEKEKELYREWYESKVIDVIKEGGEKVFTDYGSDIRNRNHIGIPTEAISLNLINAYLQERGPTAIADIPTPSALTKYNEEYEDIVLSAISMLGEVNYLGRWDTSLEYWDILAVIPEEYRTDKVVLEAIKKHPKYLDYADIESENFEKLLQIGYKSKLESMGRTELSEQEIGLMKKFAKNNSNLFSTLNLDILTPEIISYIGERNIERLARYTDVQYYIIKLAKDKDALITVGFALENLKQDSLFIEPLIEQLSKSNSGGFYYETDRYNIKPDKFLKLASSRIQDSSIPLTEEEKTIISYLALNPQESNKIKNYDEILNFVANKNAELDETIGDPDVTLVAAKNAYLERVVGMDYDSTIELIKKYGNDPEQLLAKYEGKELETYKEKSEKESLEIIIKLKSLVQETDLGKIRQAYQEAIEKEDKTKPFERYRQCTILDNTLRRAYGRDITRTLSDHDRENNTESVEHTEDGQEYVVRKMNGPFNRMVSVMNAYRRSDAKAEGDMYDRWNTSAMAKNHALCYSFINEANPGTAAQRYGNGVIISISGFDAEAVTAVAPYDLRSDSRNNTTVTYRQQMFYTTNNLPEQTRGLYSEVVIELQDVSGDVTEYKKIQPTSIICFEEINEDSINAAIELSKKLGRTIPIELIDRRELASQMRLEIDGLLEQFKRGEGLQPELVGQIITKFNETRNALRNSGLADELVGERVNESSSGGIIREDNPEAIFNRTHLNEMLSECIDVGMQRIEKGQVQEGLQIIEQIKQFIKVEREKYVLAPTMYYKQIHAGIDVDIDYRLDEIQRTYGSQEISADARNESLELLQANSELSSPAFDVIYGKMPEQLSFSEFPEQLSFSEFKERIDVSEIQRTVKEIHQKGYYSRNQSYSEEHIARVAMFANVIANLEGADDKTKRLLHEAVKYYSSGRILDDEKEEHQKYSAKIAGQELSGKYSQTDVGIIQAAIELQNLSNELDRREKVTELCNKYGLNVSDEKQIDTIATYLDDSVTLDTNRFLIDEVSLKSGRKPPAIIPTLEVLLKTDTARRLIKASYCMQDQLSAGHLKEMAKVAHIDYEAEKDVIMEEFFTEYTMGIPHNIVGDGIIRSPMVQEIYFRHKYKEIADPVKLGRELRKSQREIQTQTKATAETPVYTEQQIGKATINTPTIKKDNAQKREKQDEQELRKMQESISGLEQET